MSKGEQFSNDKGNHFHRYLEYASSILTKFKGEEPFHVYLKKHFSANKKHGSRDRKIITSLCYNYFRLGFAVSSCSDLNEQLLLSFFLIEKKHSALLEFFKPEWNEKISLPLSEKLKLLNCHINLEKIFPFNNELSDEIDVDLFNLSFLIQPKLFIRIRPGKESVVLKKLQSANISFEKINNFCVAFSNTEKVSEIINIDKDAVIQDYNSQRTGHFITSNIKNPAPGFSLWDCCAASGGKSILAFDLIKNIELTVTDTRKSILENLKARFLKAGIKNYTSFVCDLSISPLPLEIKERPPFDFIIADVPCSGSGTWSRTPEQLEYFARGNIEKYASLQQKIVGNAGKFLKSGGYFLYITCSVFKKENERNVEFIKKEMDFNFIDFRYLKGYEMQADTLFAALFQKK
jgi:16S rRNA (cytosine967-C5)-methyltransferase